LTACEETAMAIAYRGGKIEREREREREREEEKKGKG
jgi:hypothetical protein